MSKSTVAPPAASRMADDVPMARKVPIDAPWNWLAAGWRDLWQAPHIGLAYGFAVATGGGALVAGLLRHDAASLFLALAGGFLLIGPLLAVGLYETSRLQTAGRPAVLSAVLGIWASARGQLGFFGAVLLFAFLVWLQLAFLLLLLFLGSSGLPPPSAFMHTLLFTANGLGLLIVGTVVGGLLAALVFSISVFAVPMLLVRQVDAVTAAVASLAAVRMNVKPLMLWAALIAVLMAAGFATLFVGLVVTFPLIGHATWHAYADVFSDHGAEKN